MNIKSLIIIYIAICVYRIMIDGLHPSREARPLLALEILEQAGY